MISTARLFRPLRTKYRRTAVNRRFAGVMMLLAGLGFMGCAQIQPPVSHAHIGHALTAWHDTPNQQGLLAVARQRAEAALEAAQEGQGLAVSARQARGQLRRIRVELTPEALADDAASRYGLISAFEGAMEHLDYAVQAEDASANMIAAVADISAIVDPLAEQLRNAAQLAAQTSVAVDSDTLFTNLASVRQTLRRALAGYDANGDGQISLTASEAGLTQIEQALQAALQRERNPAYQPVARKYLFGLVRLPDGKWLFRPNNFANSGAGGGYDYRN